MIFELEFGYQASGILHDFRLLVIILIKHSFLNYYS